MMYKCGYCDKFFTSKKKRSDHERKVHPATEQPITPARESAKGRNISESERAREQKVIPATERNAPIQELIIKKPTRGDAPNDALDAAVYHCNDCGTAIEKGQEICPGCGERLVWDGVE
jgi:DNA-directed RNA polymerase subunit RPC12/RpoP